MLRSCHHLAVTMASSSDGELLGPLPSFSACFADMKREVGVIIIVRLYPDFAQL